MAHSATILGAGSQDQSTNFEVTVTLDINEGATTLDDRIRPGMSATATIVTARHADVIAVPIQALAARPPVSKEMTEDEGEQDGRDNLDEHNSEDATNHGGAEGTTSIAPAGAFTRIEPVEVVFVVMQDTTDSVGLIGKLLGREPSQIVAQRVVELGISSDTHYEILAGLEAAEMIVIGSYRAVSKELQNGSRINSKAEGRGKNSKKGPRGSGR